MVSSSQGDNNVMTWELWNGSWIALLLVWPVLLIHQKTLPTRGLWSQLAPLLLVVWLWAYNFTSLIPHFLLYKIRLIIILTVSVESHYISVCSHVNEWMFYPAVVNCLVAIKEVCHFCGGEKQWEVNTIHWTSLGAEDLEMTPNLLIPWAMT